MNEEDMETYFPLLSPLTNLKYLRVVDRSPEPDHSEQLDLQLWLPLIESLPNLKGLILPYYKSTFRYETELRQYLKRVDRQFFINSSEFVHLLLII